MSEVETDKIFKYLERMRIRTDIASVLTGETLLVSNAGIMRASEILEAQKMKIRPAESDKEIFERIRGRVAVQDMVDITLDAVHQGNYSEALKEANHLHYYGENDLTHDLGGLAIASSYSVHREFARQLVHDYSGLDSFLSTYGRSYLTAARREYELCDFKTEYGINRYVMHTAVFNGTLGLESRRSFFDPAAIGIAA